MASIGQFRGATGPRDRAKALAAVVIVHTTLAAIILSGLDVETVQKSVERLKMFHIPEPLPERLADPPPPRPEISSAPERAAAPSNVRSRPTPMIAPAPQIRLGVPPKIKTARVKGPEGPDRTAGASDLPGSGTGAGGYGDGFGGGGSGGSGSGSSQGFTPALKITKIPDSAYRRISAMGMRQGRVGLTVRVEPNGAASNCRIVLTSGSPAIDALMCQLTLQHVRFRPARDPAGRAIPQDITWTPDWSPR